MNLFLITIFVRSCQEFCSLYTIMCRIIHASYFWHAILQTMHVLRHTMHGKRRNGRAQFLINIKTSVTSFHYNSTNRPYAVATRALYDHYKGLVASLQRLCSIRTRPLYENFPAKTTNRNSQPGLPASPPTPAKRPRKAAGLPKIVSRMADMSKSICTFATLTADFHPCGVPARAMLFGPAQSR